MIRPPRTGAGMELDQLALVEHPDQPRVGPHLDVLADQVVGRRPHPGRVEREPPGLGVFDERMIDPGWWRATA